MTEVQKNLNQMRYEHGRTVGLFWGCIWGFLVGIAVTFLVITFI